MATNHSGNVTVVVMKLEPGLVLVKVTDPRPDPDRTELLLRKTIDSWFAERPNLAIDRTEAISDQDELIGMHVWYHVAEDRPQPTSPPKPHPDSFTIEIFNQILGNHSKEYLEAVLADAMEVLRSYEHRHDILALVNPRRVAVLLDRKLRRGAIVPYDLLEQALSAPRRARLQAWLAAPPTRFFVMRPSGWKL